MRKTRVFFVNGGPLHLALRQLQDEFSRPVTLAALAGVAVILGISGPFDTLRLMPFPARLAYWGAVVPLTYGAGFLGTALARPLLPAGPRLLRMALAALAAAFAVALVLGTLNRALGFAPDTWIQALLGFSAVYVICLVIEGIGAALRHSASGGQVSAKGPPALLARLPLHLRGTIWALLATDHYTTVITEKGREMVLIRLADAIALSSPAQGLQIHRSHWVSLAGVAKVQRLGDGTAAVVLHDGTVLPIARARIHDARRLGLLPDKGVSTWTSSI